MSVHHLKECGWCQYTILLGLSLLKSTRHICLRSAFISQRASDSFGKLKAHVYSCRGTSHYRAIYGPTATLSTWPRCWPGLPCLMTSAARFVNGGDTLFSLAWAPLSLPSQSHNQCFSFFGEDSKGNVFGKEHQQVMNRDTWLVSFWKQTAFVHPLQKSWLQNKIDMPFLFLNPCSLWDGAWWSQHTFHLHFSPPLNLIANSFFNNTDSECNVNLLYQGLEKATLWVEKWKFIRLSILSSESFFFFFLSDFGSTLPKVMAMAGSHRCLCVSYKKGGQSRQLSPSRSLSAKENLHNWMAGAHGPFLSRNFKQWWHSKVGSP